MMGIQALFKPVKNGQGRATLLNQAQEASKDIGAMNPLLGLRMQNTDGDNGNCD